MLVTSQVYRAAAAGWSLGQTGQTAHVVDVMLTRDVQAMLYKCHFGFDQTEHAHDLDDDPHTFVDVRHDPTYDTE